MRFSKAFILTQRENPRDADVVSQQLMMRSSMIRKHGAGLYSYLPLLVKSHRKLVQIIREECEAIDWQEVTMPFVVPAELWKESGRWGTYGKAMLRLRDRKDNEFCLGPTFEEVATDLVRSQVTSYKQLPLTLFQMGTKFRDEIRPRFGLMRGREFEMMDGYSFHSSAEDLNVHYEAVAKAYGKIFDRAGLNFVRVEADTGDIGGSGSHEFHVLAKSGEDAIFSCAKCGYAANVEKAETPLPEKQGRDWGQSSAVPFAEVSTPVQKTIEEVSQHLGVPTHRNLKTLVYRFLKVEDPSVAHPVVVFMMGHRQLNETKLKVALTQRGFNVLDLSPMSEKDVAALFGCEVGFLGPIEAPEQAVTIFDREVLAAHDIVAGANRPGFHLQHLEPSRDFTKLDSTKVVDLGTVVQGDACPRCDGVYSEQRGIEVGHIFKLGTKYSQPMNAVYQDAKKENVVMEMGTYGIGITRVLAAAIEQNHDEAGIIWPEAIAPFHVHLINLAPDDAKVAQVANDLYAEFTRMHVEVLFDDRMDANAGVKFKDADLIGVPKRLVVGKKGLEKGKLEYSHRKNAREKIFLKFDALDPGGLNRICNEVREK